MLRTISSLANAGSAAITIEDQIFPKRCTIAAGSKIQIVNRDEALERVKCALGARDLYNERYQSPNLNDSESLSGVGPWIVARTDCRMAYGFSEVVERCLRFEELGAEIIYAENLQTIQEYETLRARLDRATVTMVAQVQETIDARDISDKSNSKPLLTTQEIGEMGFDLALFGVTPLQCVVGTLESTAREFLHGTTKGSGAGIISSQTTMADFATVKKVVGFEELEAFESNFPCTSTKTTTSDDNDLVQKFEDIEIEEYKATIDTDIINGSQEGHIVTKVYNVPLEGFPKDDSEEDIVSLCSIFSPNDINRLGLKSSNVTLPSALMLLDPEAYPTQSRARKAIRQRSICICRYENSKFDQLGKVLSRIFPGDKIGVQNRAGNDYYSAEGANYRPPPFELPVIYEDEYLAIVNKPAGVVLYRDKEVGSGVRGGHGRDTLLSALPYVLAPSNVSSCEAIDSPLRRPQPVHRLDRVSMEPSLLFSFHLDEH